MRKIKLFAVVATLIVAGFGGWAASSTNARVAVPSVGQEVEPFQLMKNAKELPTVEFADYTFVFH